MGNSFWLKWVKLSKKERGQRSGIDPNPAPHLTQITDWAENGTDLTTQAGLVMQQNPEFLEKKFVFI